MDGYGLVLDIPKELETMQLPSSELLNFYLLRGKRIFYIDYDIDIDILQIQREIIRINFEDYGKPVNERIPIKILIDSNGGLLSETMALVATIEQSQTPVYTINVAGAYSGGCLLLISGHRRFAMPYSKALIHSGNGELSGTHEQIVAQTKKYEREIKVMGDYICSHTKITPKFYAKKKNDEWYLDVNEQIEYGLVDEQVKNLYDLLYCED